jgi:uncharacterized cysteine cluster protein YcgN (CxxCxxCC family)
MVCHEDEAEIFADFKWLCPTCEFELAAEDNAVSALELAKVIWGEARIVK